MISQAQSLAHIACAAAISAAMLGVAFGVVGPRRVRQRRVRKTWLLGGVVGATMTAGIALAELDVGRISSSLLGVSLAVLAGLGAGAALLRAGFRGRFVGDHPHCRRCGFDLFGRRELNVVCNECGADLNAPRATGVGVRQRRAVPLVAGAFVLIVALAVGASIGRSIVANGGQFSLARLMPIDWVASRAFAVVNSPAAADALSELAGRKRANELSDADYRTIVDAATRAPQSSFWTAYWVTEAWQRGAIDEAATRAYIRRHVTLLLTLAERSTPTRVPFQLWPSGGCWEMGGATTAAWTLSFARRVDTLNGTTVPPSAIAAISADDTFGYSLDQCYRLDAAPLSPGPATVRVQLMLTLTFAVPGRPTLVEDIPVDVSGTTQVLAGRARTFRSDGERDRAMDRLWALVAAPDVAGRVTIAIRAPQLAQGHRLIGDAFARDANGVETPLGEVNFYADATIVVDAARLPAGPLAIVLRPVPTRASEFVVDVEAYEYEVVIDADRVTRLPPINP